MYLRAAHGGSSQGQTREQLNMSHVVTQTTRPPGPEDKKHTSTLHSHANLYASAALAK